MVAHCDSASNMGRDASYHTAYQKRSPERRIWPREHVLKSLALTSKPTSPHQCPVLGRGQHYF